MSFDQEWSQLKAAAAEKQQTRMQLNQLRPDPGGSGSPGGDLQVSNKDLAAIGDEAFKLYQRLDKDGDHAKRSSEEAAGALKADFSIGGALGDVTAKWESAANSLLESCAHISNHLDYTQKAHAGDEYYIATTFSVEQLDKGFSEGTGALVKYEALRFADFSKLTTAVGDWTAMITKLEQLSDDARTQLSDRAKSANWQGVNATVTKEFIGKTALEFADAVKQATSIRNILRDTQDELTEYRRLLNEAISRGLKKNLTVIGNADGTFTVTMNRHPDRGADGTDIPEPAPHTPQDVTALRDEVKGILDKATSSDDSAAKALRGLAELSKYGFSDAPVIQNRDQAGTALHNWRIRQQGIEEERQYLKRTPHPPTGDGGKTEYGKANPAEKEMVLKHPLDGATYLSISAWAMRTAREEYEKDPSIDENAFRHTIWQARLSYEMGPEKAREWADAHEAYHPTSEQPDHMADLVNNVHGRDLGKKLSDEIPYRPPSEYDPGSMIDVYPRIMDEARRYAKSGEAATSSQFEGF